MHLRPRPEMLIDPVNILSLIWFVAANVLLMSEQRAPQKPTSKFMLLVYVILGIILLTVFLEVTGLADVAGKRENQEIIDRPHDR